MKADQASPRVASRRTLIAAGAAIAALGTVPPAVARAGAGGTSSVGVVGAGVIGLNVARVFAEHGYRVTVYAARVSPGTTSDVAPAVLFPHLIPATAQMTEAARRSNEFYASFLNAGVGVAPRTVLILQNTPDLDPDLAPWGPSYGGIAPIPRDQVPVNFSYGWSFQTMLVDVRRFFPYLMNRVLAAGTTITLRTVATRDDLLALPHPIIANCSGLGARELVGDQAVYPFKGQLVLINPIPLENLVVHDNDYVFPRGDQAILGGTNEAHVEDPTPSEAVTQGIIERNRSVVPSLSRSDVIEVRAGLRPFREGGPRIEAERAGDKLLLHNYGHGGGGWSLAPGCAELLFDLLTAAV